MVYADMVGYSRLIGLDDAGTLRRLQAVRRDLIDPAIEEARGRPVNTRKHWRGLSLLIAFDTPDRAVRCAVQVQQRIPIPRNQPTDRAIRLPVKINIGDTIAEGSEVI